MKEYTDLLVTHLGEGWSLKYLMNVNASCFTLQAPDGSIITAYKSWNSDKMRFQGIYPSEDSGWVEGRPAWHCSPQFEDGPEVAAEAILTKLWPRWKQWTAEWRALNAETQREDAQRIAVAQDLMRVYQEIRGVEERPEEPTLSISCLSLKPLRVRLETCDISTKLLGRVVAMLGKEVSS